MYAVEVTVKLFSIAKTPIGKLDHCVELLIIVPLERYTTYITVE